MSKLFLLDTHALIWATSAPDRLSARVKEIMESNTNQILISVATLWELSIKNSLGKIQLPSHFFDTLFSLGYRRLSIEESHLKIYRALPRHHRDPFDRLLIAQAKAESIALVSSDSQLAEYDVDLVWK